MERVEYDPEIDPTIREAREAAERERELSQRIRIEIERYVAEADLAGREKNSETEIRDEVVGDEEAVETPRERRQRLKNEERQQRETQKESRRAAKTERRKGHRRAIASVFTGSILTSGGVRRLWPYMLGVATVMVLYIAGTFQLQKLHLEHQRLQRQVRELGVRAVQVSAERVTETRRSAIVERLAAKGIPLEEFPNPVKIVEKE